MFLNSGMGIMAIIPVLMFYLFEKDWYDTGLLSEMAPISVG